MLQIFFKSRLLSICFVLICCFLLSCTMVKSRYSTELLDNETVCIFVNIENKLQRVFNVEIKDQPFVSDLNTCDYLLVSTIYKTELPLANASGVRMEKETTIMSLYTLYKYNKRQKIKVQKAFENTSIQEFYQYTSGKNASMSKGSGVTMNEVQEMITEFQGIINNYSSVNDKMREVLLKIGSGSKKISMSYFIDSLLLTASDQSRDDVETQLAKELAHLIMDTAIFDIIDWKKDMHIRECRRYYDAFIDIDWSKYVLTNEMTVQDSDLEWTDQQKLDLKESCQTHFVEYQREKKRIKEEEAVMHKERLAGELPIRIKLERSNMRHEIEEYINRDENSIETKRAQSVKEFREGGKMDYVDGKIKRTALVDKEKIDKNKTI